MAGAVATMAFSEVDGQPGRRKALGVLSSTGVMLLPGASSGSWVTSRDLEQEWAPVGVEAWLGATWHAGPDRSKVERSQLWEFPTPQMAPSQGHPQTAVRR